MKISAPLPSIRNRLTVGILSTSLVMLLLTGGAFLGLIYDRLVSDFDSALEGEADALARDAELIGRTIVWDVPEMYLRRARGGAESGFCELFLDDGTVVGRSDTLGANDLPRLARRTSAAWNAMLPDGRRGRFVEKVFRARSEEADASTAPPDPEERVFRLPDERDPADVRLTLVVGRSRERLDALIMSLFSGGGVLAVALACGLALHVRSAIGRGLRPVEELNAQIAAVGPDALGSRIRVARPPIEVAAIEAAVNGLLERLHRAFEKERRFSSDLAHELRTPVAELRAACEVGERWPNDAESARAFFCDARRVAIQLERLVTTLLDIARSEERPAPAEARPVRLKALVEAAWRQVTPQAAERRMILDERLSPDLIVETDEGLMMAVVRNLVENAVIHGEPGTTIACGGGRSADGVALWFANRAPELDRADLDHLFERFWRKDASRGDRRHIGLGLSIARALCENAGVRLLVDLHDNQQFEARIVFSTASAACGAETHKVARR